MTRRKSLALIVFGIVIAAAIYGGMVIRRGFSTRAEPSYPERVVARAVRNLSIPGGAKNEANPWKAKATPDTLKEARDTFMDRCATCHGNDGAGETSVGRNLTRGRRTCVRR